MGSNASKHDKPFDKDCPWDRAAEQVRYLGSRRSTELVVAEAAKSRRVRAALPCPRNVYRRRDAKKARRKTQVKAVNGKHPIYTEVRVNEIHVQIVTEAFLKLITSVIKND